MTTTSSLPFVARLVGSWTTEATHPAVPGTIVRGTATIEWLEGERFLIFRARTDHPDFPDSISIIGCMAHGRADASGGVQSGADEAVTMHYYDSRGVYREYAVAADATALRFAREDPGFSQRFTGTFAERGDALVGQWQVCEDGVHWKDDLAITFRRSS
jgi:hypothetical protein